MLKHTVQVCRLNDETGEWTTENLSLFDAMMAFEEGELLEHEVEELMTHLVITGMIHRLQGFYGRCARDRGLL